MSASAAGPESGARAGPGLAPTRAALLERAGAWFAARGWTVFPFQRAVWRAALQGKSGLLHASTGSGKTFAVWIAALLRAHARPGPRRAWTGASGASPRWPAIPCCRPNTCWRTCWPA